MAYHTERVPVRVYRPNQQSGWSPAIWHEMALELLSSRELIARLLIRDFSARYRQSLLGVLWALILPMVAMGTFVFLQRSGVLNVADTGVPYPVYVLLGLTVWQIFASGLSACSNAIVSGGSMVVKLNFPKETLVIAALGQVLVEAFVRSILLVVVLIVFQVTPHWTAVFLPLVLMPIVLLTLGLGFFLALVNVVLRDVANIISVVCSFLMFLTPVVYPAPASGPLAIWMAMNPLSPLLTGTRDLLFKGYLTDPHGIAWSAMCAVVVVLVSWRVFHLVEPRMAERV